MMTMAAAAESSKAATDTIEILQQICFTPPTNQHTRRRRREGSNE